MQASKKGKRVKSILFKLFEDEGKLVDCFIKTDFLNLIEKHDMDFAVRQFYKR